MAISISKQTTIHDCAIYPAHDGIPEAEQAADGVDITLPALEFESSDIQAMGVYSMPDFTRLGNLEVTATVKSSDKNSEKLFVVGEVAEWVIRWFTTIVEPGNNSRQIAFTAYARGYLHTIPGDEVAPGGEGTGSVAMNCLSLKKTDSDGHVYYDIDRMAKRLVINGTDLRAQVNQWI